MNYLAHAYLSFQNPEILAGNLISDFVKGKQKFSYPPLILAGIHLHRFIDEFTDQHPATHRIKAIFRPHYGLYGGAFADVVYDHFLATDTTQFPGNSLAAFSQWVYNTLDQHETTLPEKFRNLLPYMKRHDWLYNYRSREGIMHSLAGLVRRAKYMDESDTAFRLFEEYYETIQDCYREFFPDMQKMAFQQYQQLLAENT